MNYSCLSFYDGAHGCEQPGTNPGCAPLSSPPTLAHSSTPIPSELHPWAHADTVGPEMIYEEKVFVDRCLEMVDDHPSPEAPFFLNYW